MVELNAPHLRVVGISRNGRIPQSILNIVLNAVQFTRRIDFQRSADNCSRNQNRGKRNNYRALNRKYNNHNFLFPCHNFAPYMQA